MGDSQTDTDVLIVGGGIAGPALACAVRNSGLRVTLIEKSAAPPDTARGDHLQPRTCEILDQWGVLDDFFRNGAEKRRNAVWLTPDGEEFFRSEIGTLAIPHPYFAYLNHENISATLLAAAARSPDFELIRPIRNWWPEKSGNDRLRVRVGLDDGSERVVTASLLVAADGRASRTRRNAKIITRTHRYRNPIGVLFARRSDADPDNGLRVFVSNTRMVSVIPRTGGGCKIGVPMSPDEVSTWRRGNSDGLARRLAEMIPALRIEDVRFGDVYPPIYLQTERWVTGNMVLIGDACHAMHPARSQGMNIAIRCIDALAKRLADSGTPLDPDRVGHLLADYEAAVKPRIDEVLSENHRRGLEMDSMDGAGYAKLVKSMRRLQQDPQALWRYSMNAAGYADAKPVTE